MTIERIDPEARMNQKLAAVERTLLKRIAPNPNRAYRAIVGWRLDFITVYAMHATSVSM